MKFKIKQFIFTDKLKNGKDLMREGVKYFALHLEVQEVKENKGEEKSFIVANEHGKWISTFYDTSKKEEELANKIRVGEVYDISYSQNGQWKNINTIKDLNGNIIIDR